MAEIFVRMESEADIVIRNSASELNGLKQERTDSFCEVPNSNLEISSHHAMIRLQNRYACNDASGTSALGGDTSLGTSSPPDLVLVGDEESGSYLDNSTGLINVEGSVVCSTLSSDNGPSDFTCEPTFSLESV